jgi:Ca2+-binding RTX toxin-like protein
MLGRTLGVLVTMALMAMLPAAAAADVDVGISDGTVSATVRLLQGADGDHGIIVEPFAEVAGRNGWRVRPDGFGRPSFAEGDVDCAFGFVENDVVCVGRRTGAVVTGGDGVDVVAVSERPGGQESLPRVTETVSIGGIARSFPLPDPGSVSIPIVNVPGAGLTCLEGSQVGGQVRVSTLGGDDFVVALAANDCPPGAFLQDGFLAALTADGGGGNDLIRGGPLDDDLRGSADDDVLEGGEGSDRINGGPGRDIVRGGPGDRDEVVGGSGPDIISGLDGENDTVSYQGAPTPVSVTFDGVADDGAAGEGDNVLIDVEHAFGGRAGDTLTGNVKRNDLGGLEGPDRLDGKENFDRYSGGTGNDIITARDGLRETIACGDGADTLISDLVDPRPADCEAIRAFAVDDGPPATIRRLRVRGRTAVVRLLCPRGARIACAGVLTLRPRRGGPALGSRRYRVALGRRGTVRVPLRRAAGRRVSVETIEDGVSDKGPRSALRTLRVR